MWSTRVTALLLLFAMISIPGDAVKFPFVFGEASETIKKEVADSYFHCLEHSDQQNMTLFVGDFLENLLVKAEPYIDMMSETGLISCWLKKALRPALSCYNHVDKDFYTMLGNNMDREMILDIQEFLRCSSKPLKEKSCFQMYSRIYGSTPDMLRQSKGE
ncbi:hypothetical protein NFI96_015206 [Prochilodus magdalenae]|nr:hypothetical protein NFI96_015206 [Prochilodus magdalenae]